MTAAEAAKLALALLAAGAQYVGKLLAKPFILVLPKPLKGPYHVYPVPGTIVYQHAPHVCLHCPRYDQDETPYTDPPCPRTKL